MAIDQSCAERGPEWQPAPPQDGEELVANSVANLAALNRRTVDAPPFEVGQGLGVTEQALVVERDRRPQDRFSFRLGYLTWDWCDARALRSAPGRSGELASAEPVGCLAEGELLDQFDKRYHVAADVAAIAAPGLVLAIDEEVWSATIGVQRAPTDQRAPLRTELDAVAGSYVFDRVGLLEGHGIHATARP